MSGDKCPGGTCPGGFCPVTVKVTRSTFIPLSPTFIPLSPFHLDEIKGLKKRLFSFCIAAILTIEP